MFSYASKPPSFLIFYHTQRQTDEMEIAAGLQRARWYKAQVIRQADIAENSFLFVFQ